MPAMAYTPPYARINATRLTLKVGSVTMPYPAYKMPVSCQNGQHNACPASLKNCSLQENLSAGFAKQSCTTVSGREWSEATLHHVCV